MLEVGVCKVLCRVPVLPRKVSHGCGRVRAILAATLIVLLSRAQARKVGLQAGFFETLSVIIGSLLDEESCIY
jgi:hypothetical protein